MSVWSYVAVLCVFLIAVAARFYTWPSAIFFGRMIPPYPDAHYHLRIIELLLHGHAQSPLFDWYTNFPVGGGVYWPLGFDWLMAGLSLPVFLATSSMDAVAWMLGLLMPMFGALTVMMVYRISVRATGDWSLSIAVALLPALSLLVVSTSLVGRIDHQVFELLLLALIVLIQYPLFTTEDRTRATFLGIVLGLGLWFWNGFVLHVALSSSMFLAGALVAPPENSLFQNWKRSMGIAFGVAIAVTIGFGAIWSHPFSSVYLSGFHLACYALAALAPPVVRLVMGLDRKKKNLILIAVPVFCGAALLLLVSMHNNLLDFLLRKDPNAFMVTESQSPLTVYGWALLFQPLVVLGIVNVAWCLLRIYRREYESVFLLPLLAVTAVLGLMQIRFLPYFQLVNAMALPLLIGRIDESAPRRRNGWIITLLMMAMVPFVLLTRMSSVEQNRFPLMRSITPVMEWLKSHTPVTSNYLKPEEKPSPAYGVFCPMWSYGHFVNYLAKRPTNCSPFGATAAFQMGIEATIRGTLAESEQEFYDLTRTLRTRYVIAMDMSGLLNDYARALRAFGRHVARPDSDRNFMDRLFNWSNGTTDKLAGSKEGFAHFRLVHNSRSMLPDSLRSLYRVYEIVPGATVQGRVPDPEGGYVAAIVLEPEVGRPVLYRRTLRPDPDGVFSFTCPYNTRKNGDLKAISVLEIWDMETHQVIQRCRISEADVQNGSVVHPSHVVRNASFSMD